jgi:uncharacterized membrane protein
MSSSRRHEWMIPASLVLLSFVPALGGMSRLAQLGGGAAITSENARFFASPIPIIIHIFSAIPFSILGAFQFAPTFRRKHRSWHRSAGRVLVVLGLITALSGLWMTLFYPWAPQDGAAVYVERLIFGSIMLASMLLGVDAIRRRKFELHGQWMLRAYAVGMGAGTQVITHLPYFIIIGQPHSVARGWLMGSAWVINLLVAERIISKQQHAQSHARSRRAREVYA